MNLKLLATWASAALAVCAAAASPAVAQQATDQGTTATTLALSADARMDSRGRPVPGQLVLNATLTQADGKPLNNRVINFYQQVDLLGPHDAFVGTANTDATGVAALLYEAPQPGLQQLKARFPGAPGYAPQEAGTSAQLKEGIPPFQAEPIPLGKVASGLSVGALLLVSAVWLVLLGVLVRTVTALRAAGAPARERRARARSTENISQRGGAETISQPGGEVST